jgi:hypothetical protein
MRGVDPRTMPAFRLSVDRVSLEALQDLASLVINGFSPVSPSLLSSLEWRTLRKILCHRRAFHGARIGLLLALALALAYRRVGRLPVINCLCCRRYSFLRLPRMVMAQRDLQQEVNNREALHMA